MAFSPASRRVVTAGCEQWPARRMWTRQRFSSGGQGRGDGQGGLHRVVDGDIAQQVARAAQVEGLRPGQGRQGVGGGQDRLRAARQGRGTDLPTPPTTPGRRPGAREPCGPPRPAPAPAAEPGPRSAGSPLVTLTARPPAVSRRRSASTRARAASRASVSSTSGRPWRNTRKRPRFTSRRMRGSTTASSGPTTARGRTATVRKPGASAASTRASASRLVRA